MLQGFLLIAIGAVGIVSPLFLLTIGGPGSRGFDVQAVLFYGGVFLVFCGIVRIGWVVGRRRVDEHRE